MIHESIMYFTLYCGLLAFGLKGKVRDAFINHVRAHLQALDILDFGTGIDEPDRQLYLFENKNDVGKLFTPMK